MADESVDIPDYLIVINIVVGCIVSCFSMCLFGSLYTHFHFKKLRDGDNIKEVQGLIIHKYFSRNGHYHIKYVFNIDPAQTHQQIYSTNMAIIKGFTHNETVLIPSVIMKLIEKFYGGTQFSHQSVINQFGADPRDIPPALFDVGAEIEILFDPNKPFGSSRPKVIIQNQEYQNGLRLQMRCCTGTILCIVVTYSIILCACQLWWSLLVFVAGAGASVLVLYINSITRCDGRDIENYYYCNAALIQQAEEKAAEQDTSSNESV